MNKTVKNGHISIYLQKFLIENNNTHSLFIINIIRTVGYIVFRTVTKS